VEKLQTCKSLGGAGRQEEDYKAKGAWGKYSGKKTKGVASKMPPKRLAEDAGQPNSRADKEKNDTKKSKGGKFQ